MAANVTGQPGGTAGRIVVGVDGSEPSRAALRWALRQARMTGATVEAVTAWEFPPTYGWDMSPVHSGELESAAVKTNQEVIKDVAGSQAEVTVEPLVIEGNAARVLLAAAEGADLIVVGSRGHGGFTGALLGSVSHSCVQHAACPVVVIRGPH